MDYNCYNSLENSEKRERYTFAQIGFFFFFSGRAGGEIIINKKNHLVLASDNYFQT